MLIINSKIEWFITKETKNYLTMFFENLLLNKDNILNKDNLNI